MKPYRWLFVTAALALAACSGYGAPSTPNVPASSAANSQERMFAPGPRGSKSYKSETFALSAAGGKITLPNYAGFKGPAFYLGNNAPSGTTLTFTNSGTNNLLSAPSPPNLTPILYAQASISGAGSVTFQGGKKTKLIEVQSSSIQFGYAYTLYIYSGGTLLETLQETSEADGIARFVTPFANGFTLYSGTPVTIELAISDYPQSLFVTYGGTGGGVSQFNANSFGPPINFFPVPDAVSLAVDDAENFYVGADAAYPGDIEEFFTNGQTYAYTNAGLDIPEGLAVTAGASPALLVANYNYKESSDPQFLEFPQQESNQSIPYTDPNLYLMDSLALDGGNGIFVGGDGSGGPEIDLVQFNVGQSNLGLSLSGTPIQLAVDTNGNLLVDEQGTGVAVFAPGQTTPMQWIGPQGSDPESFALGDYGNTIYVMYQTCQPGSCAFTVQEYSYPQNQLQQTLAVKSDNFGQIAIQPRVPLFNPSVYRKKHPNFEYWTEFLRGARMRHSPQPATLPSSTP
jgi:hypothetical protein